MILACLVAFISVTVIVSLAIDGKFDSKQASEEAVSAQQIETPLADIWAPLAIRWVGDLDGMTERGLIRVLTTFTLGSYFIDNGRQRGGVYRGSMLLEEFAKQHIGAKAKHLKVMIIPVRRDQLIPYLIQGYGDIAFANLTITPDRLEKVDFSTPFTNTIQEILVISPGISSIDGVEDLAGKEVVVPRHSSYFESLTQINERLTQQGKPPIQITSSDPRLEAEDLLEMVDAGLIPMTIIDSHRLELWSRVFKNMNVRDDIILRENSSIALAIRKKSPQLKQLVDKFVAKNRLGTKITNIIVNYFTKNTTWVKPALAREPFDELKKLVDLFKKYGKQYNFDWLLLASFAYQESGFNQNARSPVGAVGIMQILPSTAADRAVGIPDISSVETNIHAGTKYLSILRDRYFHDESLAPFEQMLFTMAGYNAGPNRINRLRKVAAKRGLDPNLWFNNVELVVAAEVGREPIRYVGNIYRYYVAYKRSLAELGTRESARDSAL